VAMRFDFIANFSLLYCTHQCIYPWRENAKARIVRFRCIIISRSDMAGHCLEKTNIGWSM